VVSQLIEPSCDVDVGLMLGDVVDEQRPHCPSVVSISKLADPCTGSKREPHSRRRDGAIALLSRLRIVRHCLSHTSMEADQKREVTSIPYLCLHCLGVDRDASRRKLDADRRFGFEIEFVPSKSREHCSTDPSWVCPIRFFPPQRDEMETYGS
jgi:hypothetical protein